MSRYTEKDYYFRLEEGLVRLARLNAGTDRTILFLDNLPNQLIEGLDQNLIISAWSIPDPPEDKRFTINQLNGEEGTIDIGYIVAYRRILRGQATFFIEEDYEYVLRNKTKYDNLVISGLQWYDPKKLYKRGIESILRDENETVTDEQILFFDEFQDDATIVTAEQIAKFNMKLIANKGVSAYLKANYGDLEGITLNDFEDAVEKEVKRIIDNPNEPLAINRRMLAIAKGNVDFEFKYPLGDGETYEYSLRLQRSTEENVLIERLKSPDQDLNTTEEREYLRTTDIYLNFKAFSNGFEFYELETGAGAAFWGIDDLIPTDSGRLGMVYLTQDEGAWYQFVDFFPNLLTGGTLGGIYADKDLVPMENLYIDYYLQFSNLVKELQEDQPAGTELNFQLERLRNEAAKNLVSVVLPRFLAKIESLRRQEIAKSLQEQQKDDEPITREEADAILGDADDGARNRLQDIADQAPKDKPKVSDETIEQRQKLFKQCVLLLNLPDLISDFNSKLLSDFNNNDDFHFSNVYNDRFYMTEINDASIPQENTINYLTTPKADDIRGFLEMTPDVHASLMPQIRLFKVFFNNEEKEFKTHELPFPSSTGKKRVDDLFKSSKDIDRGDGLGIKEFSFTFDGETPATATNYVTAKLSLFFQSFADLVKERTVIQDGIEYKFRYLDLFVNTKFCPRAGEKAFSPLYYDPSFYRLRADVGWAPRSNDAQFDSILRQRGFSKKGFMEALSKTNKTFYLNLVDHSIDIGSDGTVTVTADYIAYIEGMLSSNKLNALTTRNIQKAQEYWVKKYECVIREEKCNNKVKRRLRNAINALGNAGSKALKKRLVSDLVSFGKLYSVQIDKPRLSEFRRTDFFQQTPRLRSRVGIANNQIPTVQPPSNDATLDESWNFLNSTYIEDGDYQNNSRIHFFYLGDLIYLIMDCLYDENGIYLPEVKNIRMLLSSFVITDPFRGDVRVNIAQIPVDLETFTSWYDEQIIKKDIDSLSVIDFVKRFLFYLVANVFSESCINQDSVKRLMFQSSNILSVNDEFGSANPFEDADEFIVDVKNLHNLGQLPLPTAVANSRNAVADNFYSYLTIFPYYRNSVHYGRGNRISDENKGVYHFDIGARRGLVKKVSFSKTDIEYLRESRMFSQGANGLLQLSSVYRCTIDMIGNTLLYPGMEMWLNPFGLGGTEFGLPQNGPGSTTDPNLSNIMGLGGYQQVLKTTSTITPGSFTTTVDAHFIYSGEDDGLTNKNGKPISTCKLTPNVGDGPATQKCAKLVRSAQADIRDLTLYGVWSPPVDDDGECDD